MRFFGSVMFVLTAILGAFFTWHIAAAEMAHGGIRSFAVVPLIVEVSFSLIAAFASVAVWETDL